ncbi:hypothetical protein [Pedococcus sp. P5_B7]
MAHPFTAEVQLAAPVQHWLETFDGPRAVVHELDAGWGVADLVAARRADGSTTRDRRAVNDQMQLLVLEACRVTRTESDLRELAPHGWRSLHVRAVRPLVEAGLLREGARGKDRTYLSGLQVTDPFADLVAVELKLSNWRRALAQAVRYRIFAERSYVAMPYERVGELLIREARRVGVGVLAVAVTGVVDEVVGTAARAPLQPARRRWAGERTLSALQSPSPRPAGSPVTA